LNRVPGFPPPLLYGTISPSPLAFFSRCRRGLCCIGPSRVSFSTLSQMQPRFRVIAAPYSGSRVLFSHPMDDETTQRVPMSKVFCCAALGFLHFCSSSHHAAAGSLHSFLSPPPFGPGQRPPQQRVLPIPGEQSFKNRNVFP